MDTQRLKNAAKLLHDAMSQKAYKSGSNPEHYVQFSKDGQAQDTASTTPPPHRSGKDLTFRVEPLPHLKQYTNSRIDMLLNSKGVGRHPEDNKEYDASFVIQEIGEADPRNDQILKDFGAAIQDLTAAHRAPFEFYTWAAMDDKWEPVHDLSSKPRKRQRPFGRRRSGGF